MSEQPYEWPSEGLPEDLSRISEEGEVWLKKHLVEDVEELQMMRQHHVHLVNPDTGKREPLAACRSKENPNLCKSNYPRNKWLVREPGTLLRFTEADGFAYHGPEVSVGRIAWADVPRVFERDAFSHAGWASM